MLIIQIIILSYIPLCSANVYRAQQGQIVDDIYDISLNWEQLLGSKDWVEYKLWDNAFDHCYLSFKMNSGLDVSVPASLRLKYPMLLEPNQQFDLDATLDLANNKKATLSFEFFVKIDLDLLTPTWIPGIGLTDDFNQVYGGSWDFTFDLDSDTVQRVLNSVSFGENQIIQSINQYLGTDEFVSIRHLDINTNGLGRLAFAEIKISFLESILAAAKAATSLVPPLEALVEALDWLLTNVIKVDTGLTLYPSLNAEIIAPISASSDLIVDTTNLVFNDVSSVKTTSTSVNPLSKESENQNQMVINYGPLAYRLTFFADWSYYLDLNVDFLGINFVDEHWNWNLGTFPYLFTDIEAFTRQITCNIKLDEPLDATDPETVDGEIKIRLNDYSGISNVNLFYSTDKNTWNQASMSLKEAEYIGKPIDSVESPTTVYYYIEAIDGDSDKYTIDNNGLYFNYYLEPAMQESEPLNALEWVQDLTSGSSNRTGLLFFMVLILSIAVIVIITVWRKKRLKK